MININSFQITETGTHHNIHEHLDSSMDEQTQERTHSFSRPQNTRVLSSGNKLPHFTAAEWTLQEWNVSESFHCVAGGGGHVGQAQEEEEDGQDEDRQEEDRQAGGEKKIYH